MAPSRRCPNCKKGFLKSKGKRYLKCNRCGFIKYKSPHGFQRGSILFPKKEETLLKSEELKTPSLSKEGLSPSQDPYLSRKYKGIQKILKNLRKNKYNPIKEIEIKGELWDVKSGKLVRDKKKPSKKVKEFIPEEFLEKAKDIEEKEK